MLVAPRVFRVPEGPAAREARRPHFVRRRASKPARALRSLRRPSHRRRLWFWCARPGPAAAHQHRGRALRRPSHRRRCVAVNSPARPRRRPPALRQVPLAPFGALRTGVTCVAACGLVRVVTNVVNPRCFSCGFLSRCYKRRQSGGFFADNGGFLAWIDDVCNRGPREAI